MTQSLSYSMLMIFGGIIFWKIYFVLKLAILAATADKPKFAFLFFQYDQDGFYMDEPPKHDKKTFSFYMQKEFL